jgi:hypothetical protein
MNTRKGFTKIDVLVMVICLAFLAVNLPVLSSGGKTHAKIDVCSANLMQLYTAWQLYAEDNRGNLVNGAPSGGTSDNPVRHLPASYKVNYEALSASGVSNFNYKAYAPLQSSDECCGFWPWHQNELPWKGPTRRDPSVFYAYAPGDPEAQRGAIETGALWKYIRQHNIYRCPVGKKGELVTYLILDSMNGMWKYRSNDNTDLSPVKSRCYKSIGQIKQPSHRAVFIDVGFSSAGDSFAVYYDRNIWYEYPPVRHENGTLLSFADGHTEYWQWKGQETIDLGKAYYAGTQPWPPTRNPPSTCGGINDVYKMQIACWGAIGYTPSLPPNCTLDPGF